MSAIPKQKIFWPVLLLVFSFLFSFFTSTEADAATPAYRMINNQTIKHFYVEDFPGEKVPSTVRYYVASTPQPVGNSGGADQSLWFVGITEADNNPTICNQWINKQHAETVKYQLTTIPRTNGACASTHDPATSFEVSNSKAGEATFFFEKDTETIQTAVHTASNAEFKKIRNTSRLGLSSTMDVYVQTELAAECPALLLKYNTDDWGFIAPIMRDTYQDNSSSKYYLEILTAYKIDVSNLGGCDAGTNGVKGNNETALAEMLGGDKSHWREVNLANISFNNKLTGGRVLKLPPPTVGGPSAADIKLGNAPEGSVGATEDGNSGGGDTGTTCAIDGIGWIVCPVLNFMGGLADGAYNFLAENFLETPPALLATDDNNPVWNAWRQILSVANVLFVIGFLLIVFSQLTGVGVSNYGVKKVLPRLIMGAVLINMAFFICAIAVDLCNILGHGLKTFLENLAPAPSSATTMVQNGGSWLGIVGSVIGFGGGAAAVVAMSGGFWMALVALIGILLSAVVALVMIFFILQIRQVLIVVLIILSPIAFAAYLLPNTEPLFKKWKKVFTAMLMLYPIIGLVYGASALASNVITDIYASNATDGANDIMGQIVGAGILVLPLFIVPGLLKKALDGVGGIGGKLSAFGAKMGGKARSGVKGSGFAKYQGGLSAQRAAKIKAGKYTGRSPISKIRSSINARANTKDSIFDKATGGYGTKRGRAYDAWRGQEIKDMADGMGGYTYPDDASTPPALRRLPKDPEEIFREKLDKFHTDRNGSEADKHKAEIGLAAAQLHLSRTNGNEGSQYSKAAMDHYKSTGKVPSHAEIQAGMRASNLVASTGGLNPAAPAGGQVPASGQSPTSGGQPTNNNPGKTSKFSVPSQATPSANAQARAQAAAATNAGKTTTQSGGPVGSSGGQFKQGYAAPAAPKSNENVLNVRTEGSTTSGSDNGGLDANGRAPRTPNSDAGDQT